MRSCASSITCCSHLTIAGWACCITASDIKFNYFMGTLLRERSNDLYRSKGVLSIHGQGSTKFVFQGVHESVNFGPAAEDWKEGEPRINKMVFIGRDLDKAALREGFGKCSTYSNCLHHPA